MALSCDKCHGAAVPAARTRTFEYEGQTLRCLFLVSCCMVCGHQWEDDTYDIENANFEDEARVALATKKCVPRAPPLTMALDGRNVATTQPQSESFQAEQDFCQARSVQPADATALGAVCATRYDIQAAESTPMSCRSH